MRDRLAWLECRGFHPNCWSIENFKKLGEKWGRLLYVDHDYYGVNSLTVAKLLVQTRAQSKIEECVRLDWGSDSCDVWVMEVRCCECMDVGAIIANRTNESDDSDDELDPAGSRNHGLLGLVEGRADGMEVNTLIGSPRCSKMPLTSGNWVETERLDDNRNEARMGSVGVNLDEQFITLFMDRPNVSLEGDRLDPLCMEQPFTSATADVHNGPMIGTANKQINYVDETVNADCYPFLGPKLPPFEPRFDPMAQMECGVAPCTPIGKICSMGSKAGMLSTSKRPRGRPKRTAETPPVCANPSSPSSYLEVNKTWDTVKLIGISSNDEEAVLKELRKSKRLSSLAEDPN